MTNTPQEPQTPPVYTPPAGDGPAPYSGAYVPPATYHPEAPPYQQQHVPYGAPAQNSKGETLAIASLIVAIVGFFTVGGLIGGIAALILAHYAEKNGANAKAGKIAGWVTLGLTVVAAIFILMVLGLGFALPVASSY